jgi:magnesium-transporting ATPase (P-type)
VVEVLQGAQVRVLMITGDNPLTAIQVARKCKIARPDHAACVVDWHADSGQLTAALVRSDSMDAAVKSDWEGVLGPSPGDWDVVLTGNAFDQLCLGEGRELFDSVMQSTVVFARTSPLQKSSIVASLRAWGDNTVGMCGDGSNDCGALKTADAGTCAQPACGGVVWPACC